MSLTESTMKELGTEAPDFALPIANPQADHLNGELRTLADYDEADVLVVVFMCNHCPYVQHLDDKLSDVAAEYRDEGVQFVGICSNNVETHPSDSFERMVERAREKDYAFPYLHDETQEVAQAYTAACTPDFFVFDDDRKLVYRGRFDETRPKQGEPHGGDLTAALDELLETGDVTVEQKPSMGCNIKWKPGKAPAYA